MHREFVDDFFFFLVVGFFLGRCLGLVGLLTAFVSGDAEEFTDEVFAVSEQAVTIIDACGLG